MAIEAKHLQEVGPQRFRATTRPRAPGRPLLHTEALQAVIWGQRQPPATRTRPPAPEQARGGEVPPPT